MNSNWSYSPETPNLGQIRCFLEPRDLEIWRMTFKNNRASLLSIIKLLASFHHYMWIQSGVTVWKRLSWVVTSVTLTFDLWPWPFAWTSLLWLVIIAENFTEYATKSISKFRRNVNKILFSYYRLENSGHISRPQCAIKLLMKQNCFYFADEILIYIF